MDEVERCTEVGFIEEGRLLAKAPPRALKSSFRTRLLEVDIEPLMPALVRLRSLPELLGVSCAAVALRLYVSDPEKLLAKMARKLPFPVCACWANAGSNLTWKMFSPLIPKVTTAF